MRIRSTGVFFIGLVFVAVLGGLIGSAPAQAESSTSWVNGTVQKVHTSTEATAVLPFMCTGTTGSIKVKGRSGEHEACIYGSAGNTQFARYESLSGRYAYGFSFSLDDEFTPLRDFCVDYTMCAYGQEEDTLLVRVQRQQGLSLALIKDVTKHLRKTHNQGEFYEYTGDSPSYISFGETPAIVKTFAVSMNGKWAVVELERFGLARINLSDLTYRRVVAPGAEYGFGIDPSYELAISNDGSTVARTGWRGSIEVFEANELCGDTLTGQTTVNFSEYVHPCKRASIDVHGLFPGFVMGTAPRFSSDGTRLSLRVQYNQGVQSVTLAAGTGAMSGGLSYSAFGDSFTSGEGETSDEYYEPHTNTESNRCHVSVRSYPYLVGAFWGLPTVNRACSGGRVADVESISRVFVSQASPAELPSHVSVSIGGNDIELVGKLKTCLGLDTCEWASLQKRAQGAREIRSILRPVVNLIQGLKQDYPAAELLIVGYPRVVNTSEDASCPAIISTLLNAEERRYMDESIVYLNQVLRAAAQYTGVTYIDVSDAYYKAQLCDQSPRAMNAIRFGDDIAPVSLFSKFKVFGSESFHPTPKGHELVAGAIQRIGSNWRSQAPCICEYSEASLDPPVYWKEGDSAEVVDTRVRRSGEFLSRVNATPGTADTIRFPAATFKPESEVSVELHSAPQRLAQVTSRADGSLEGRIVFPDNATGYHTVHVYGVSFSESEVDIYQTVSLAESPEEPGVPSGNLEEPAVSLPSPSMQIPPIAPDSTANSRVYGLDTPILSPVTRSEQYAEVLGVASSIYSNESKQLKIAAHPKIASAPPFDEIPKVSSVDPRLVVVGGGIVVLAGVVYGLMRAVRRNGRYNESI